MDHIPVVLERRATQHRLLAEEARIDLVLAVRVRVNDDVMRVRIEAPEVLRHRALLRGALRVLLAEVPVDGEPVPEARDDLTEVEASFRPESATVERFGNPISALGRRT